MKVKAIKVFRDRDNGLKLRKTGELFEVTEDRATKLASMGLVERATVKTAEKKG